MCGTKRKSESPTPSNSGSSTTTATLPSTSQQVEKVAMNQKKNGLKPDVKDERYDIVWRNVIIMAYIHGVGIYGLYTWFAGHLYWTTILIGKKH